MTTAATLATPQTAHLAISAGKAVRLDTELRITPIGLLAVTGLVCAFLLSVPPIIRAGARATASRAARTVATP